MPPTPITRGRCDCTDDPESRRVAKGIVTSGMDEYRSEGGQDGVDHAVVVIDHRKDLPFFEGRARVRDDESHQVTHLDFPCRLNADVSMLVTHSDRRRPL